MSARNICNGFKIILWNASNGSIFRNVTLTVSSNKSFRRKLSSPGSYFHNVGEKQLMGSTIGEVVDQMADRFGDREAVVDCHQGIRKTFKEYKQDIDKLAMGLLALDLQKGDRLGIWSPNRYEWAVTQFASAKAGLIMVTLNPAYQPQEIEYCLSKLGMRALLITEQFRTQDYYKLMTTVVPEIGNSKPGQKVKSLKHPYFDTLIMTTDKQLPGTYKFTDVMKAGGPAEKVRLEQLQREVNFDNAVNIQFTSGTTGRPKAAVLTHHNIVNNAAQICKNIGYFREPHRICSNVPMFHCFGCVGVTLSAILSGACTVYPAPGFSAEAALQAIPLEKCTSVYGTPTMFLDILNHPKFSSIDTSRLRVGIMAGAPCPPDLIKRVSETLNVKGIVVGYGSTELSPLITLHHFQTDPLEVKMETVGKVIDHVEVKIVDSNNMLVPFGTAGEICARGYVVMKGYWGDAEKTADVVENGWYHTGDLGVMAADGYCKVVGRLKDMIIRGGENIYPREIEDHLAKHDKIFDAQVIGVPDQRLGEEACVWIKLKEKDTMTEEEIRSYCKKYLAQFKIPRYIRFVEEFPKTATGKIQKFIMREEMAKILKQQK